MSNGLIVRLVPLAPAMFTNRPGYWGINASFPSSNLADRQPKTVVQGNPAGAGGGIGIAFDVDLGADTSIDTIAIIGANLSSTAQWAIYGYMEAWGLPAFGGEVVGNIIFGANFITFGIPRTTRQRTRSAFVGGAAIMRRYLRIYLQDTTAANPDGVVNAGVLCIGQRITPTFNFELGSGRKVESDTIIRKLPGGETHTEEGGNVPIWRGTWSNLSEAEMRQIWSLQMEVGIGKPVLIIEDPDAVTGQSEGIHYGQLEALDFNERVQLEKQRWDVRIRELV